MTTQTYTAEERATVDGPYWQRIISLANAQGLNPLAAQELVDAELALVAERELTAEELTLVAELQAANEEAKAADKRKRSAQCKLTEVLGTHLTRGTSNGVTVLKRTSYDRTGIDADLLGQGWPEALQACATTTPVAYWSAK